MRAAAVAALIAGGSSSTRSARTDEREARIGLALGIAGLWATVLLADHADLGGFLFSGGLVAVSPWLAGRVTPARARCVRAALERAAASEERQRIARELHDVVAHGVVLMVLQAQGARRILDQDPERVREALEAIEETGKTALEEIRARSGSCAKTASVPRSPRSRRSTTSTRSSTRCAAPGCTVDLRHRGRTRRSPTGSAGRRTGSSRRR